MNRFRTVIVFSIMILLFSSSIITITANKTNTSLIDNTSFIAYGPFLGERIDNIIYHPCNVPYIHVKFKNLNDVGVHVQWHVIVERTNKNETISDFVDDIPFDLRPNTTNFIWLMDFEVCPDNEWIFGPAKATITITIVDDMSSITKEFELFFFLGPFIKDDQGVIIE